MVNLRKLVFQARHLAVEVLTVLALSLPVGIFGAWFLREHGRFYGTDMNIYLILIGAGIAAYLYVVFRFGRYAADCLIRPIEMEEAVGNEYEAWIGEIEEGPKRPKKPATC